MAASIPTVFIWCEGHPGTGKTTLALQFLLDGIKRGERVLYITLSESETELASSPLATAGPWIRCTSSNWCRRKPATALIRSSRCFIRSETELSETTKLIFDQVREIEPIRVVFDSLSEMRLLAQSSLRYRRQILALKHFFAGRKCTVLLLDDLSSHADDLQLHSISHGVILLEQLALDYGAERRRLR